jgi:hypothetical protein
MKIELIGATSITLADDNTLREGPQGLKLQVQRQRQVVQAIGADESDQHDRGNQQTTVTFRVRHQHATLAASAAAWLMADGPIHLKGYVKFTQGSEVRYLPKAAVSSLGAEIRGVSTIRDYTITGGRMTATAPA